MMNYFFYIFSWEIRAKESIFNQERKLLNSWNKNRLVWVRIKPNNFSLIFGCLQTCIGELNPTKWCGASLNEYFKERCIALLNWIEPNKNYIRSICQKLPTELLLPSLILYPCTRILSQSYSFLRKIN